MFWQNMHPGRPICFLFSLMCYNFLCCFRLSVLPLHVLPQPALTRPSNSWDSVISLVDSLTRVRSQMQQFVAWRTKAVFTPKRPKRN